MPIDQKAFFAESKRLQDEFGMTRGQADMLAAVKFWEGPEAFGLDPDEAAKARDIAARHGAASK
jgi:hypothetical protein